MNLKRLRGLFGSAVAAVVITALMPVLQTGGFVTSTVEAASAGTRVDAGSSQSSVDTTGQAWSADKYAFGGYRGDHGNITIANTTDPRLFQTERWGLSAYQIPVANGKYTVLLQFAENWSGITAAGQRVFGVKVNGVSLGNVDVFKLAGGAHRALTLTTTTQVTNGMLNVSFTKMVQETMIDALQIVPIVATPVPATATAVPAASTAVPATATAVPAASTAVPATATAVPATATAVPATATAVPATATAVPATATAVPATATAVPATATAVPATPTSTPVASCGPTLQSLINAAPAGSVLKVPPCLYHETITISKPLTLDGQGGPGLRGSDVWSNWTQASNGWVSGTSVPTFSTGNQGFCKDGSNRCNWPEQVFSDGKPLTQVATGTTPAAGQFALDAARHVVLYDAPAGHVLEVSTRERWVDTQSDNVTIENFTFWHAANAAETGAIGNQNRNGWVLKDSQLYSAHGGIVSLGGATNSNTQTQVLRNQIGGSGYEGIDGYLNTNTLIQGNTIFNNNLSAFDSINWAGAGVKVVSFRNLTIDNNTVYGNAGPGLWCDIDCEGATITNNHIHDNTGPGVMFEISTGASISTNSIWNVPAGVPAIFISSAASADVFNNVISGATLGVQVYEGTRTDKPASGSINISVHDNSIVAPAAATLGMVWGDDTNGHLTAATSNNRGQANAFWYPNAEDGRSRFQWAKQQFSTLPQFAATAGGTNDTYLSTAAKNTLLSSAGIPAS